MVRVRGGDNHCGGVLSSRGMYYYVCIPSGLADQARIVAQLSCGAHLLHEMG
jgi:hypothetical protein